MLSAAASSSSAASAFRTIVPITPSASRIKHTDTLVLVGSCFSENIGNKLTYYKYNVSINAFGISYNPASIQQCLDRLLVGKPFEEQELQSNNGRYFSFDHHTSFTKKTAQECLEGINQRLTQAYAFIYKCSGPEQEEGSGRIVANCHKLPGNQFTRRLLSVDEISNGLIDVLTKLKSINPKVSVIFTVSPVRHWKDGPIENSRSKAHLLASVHQVIDTLGSSWTSYFPTYELMMDDLRDYRFYDVDMLHPSPQAVDYIWSRLLESRFDDSKDNLTFMSQMDGLRRALAHRAFDPESPAHQAFLKQQLELISRLESSRPYLDFREEKTVLKKGLI